MKMLLDRIKNSFFVNVIHYVHTFLQNNMSILRIFVKTIKYTITKVQVRNDTEYQ